MADPIRWDRRGVLRADAVEQSCRVERFAPCERLADLLEHFWAVRWNLPAKQTMTGETLPHPTVHVVIEEGRSGVYGVATERFSRVLEGQGHAFGLRFHPGCFRPFSPLPVQELSERVVPLHECFGADGLRLEETVLACGDDMHLAAEHTESFLLTRLPAPDPRAQLARRIVRRVLDDPGLKSAQALADACGLGLRSLQRLFQDYVGVSPKWVIQRYRLHEAILRLDGDGEIDLAAIAVDLGFADQAHFTRQFKALVGTPPGEYVARKQNR